MSADVERRRGRHLPGACRAGLGPLLLDERRARIDEAARRRLGGLRMVIENLHDPHNGAAVLRSAEAFGVQRVDVIESAEPFRFSAWSRRGARSGSTSSPPHAGAASPRSAPKASRSTPPSGRDGHLEDLDFGRPAAVMVGNEHDGLSAEAVAAADVRFGIPMPGMTRSLNFSVATALIVECVWLLRRRALGPPRATSTTRRCSPSAP